MTEERRLLATGMPLEDAISNCYSMRRERTLEEFVRQQEERHEFKCGGACNCSDCPNKNFR